MDNIIEIEAIRKIKQELLSNKELKLLIDTIPMMVIFLDKYRRIYTLNDNTINFLKMSCLDVEGLKFGDVFKCIHSSESNNGCGFGKYCGVCPFKNAIEAVI